MENWLRASRCVIALMLIVSMGCSSIAGENVKRPRYAMKRFAVQIPTSDVSVESEVLDHEITDAEQRVQREAQGPRYEWRRVRVGERTVTRPTSDNDRGVFLLFVASGLALLALAFATLGDSKSN